MHLLIDFDYTLFNTEAMRRACIAALRPCGITEQQYRAAETELKAKKMYDSTQHLDMLASGQSRLLIGEVIDRVLSHTEEFLFPDASAFLQRHQHHTITILSFGFPAWQERKINASSLEEMVDAIIVTNQPKADMLERWKDDSELVLLNDRGSEIDAMKQLRPDLSAVWVRRPATPYQHERCDRADAEVHDLSFSIEDILPTTL
jgi:hypothetical protein